MSSKISTLGMKKFVSTSLWIFMFVAMFSYASATWTSTDNWWKTPVTTNSLNFSAKLDWSKVYTSWTSFSDLGLDWDFKYYKVIRSNSVSSPVYPDNWYIWYGWDVNKTEYTDSKLKNGTNYYRVCAMTNARDRYCSNVVKLEIESATDYKKEYYKKEVKKTTSDNLNINLKIRASNLLEKFYAKLEAKYSDDDDRIEVLSKIVTKLEALKSSKPSLKGIISYMITNIEKRKMKYQNDFEDLEDIFSDF